MPNQLLDNLDNDKLLLWQRVRWKYKVMIITIFIAFFLSSSTLMIMGLFLPHEVEEILGISSGGEELATLLLGGGMIGYVTNNIFYYITLHQTIDNLKSPIPTLNRNRIAYTILLIITYSTMIGIGFAFDNTQSPATLFRGGIFMGCLFFLHIILVLSSSITAKNRLT